MPRWIIRPPRSSSTSRYLARRRQATTCWPLAAATSAGIGQRKAGLRTMISAIDRRSMCGAIPRRVVSTSGNSGIHGVSFPGGSPGFARPCDRVHCRQKKTRREAGRRRPSTLPPVTDRVHATCTELARLGVKVDEYEDGMTIYPCNDFRSATIQTYNDHRMAMAFSLIGLRVPGVSIENPGCVSKTFPNYFEELRKLQVQR